MRVQQGFTLGQKRDDLGPDHLPKQCLFGIEVEIECSLAHSSQPGDIIQLRARKAAFAEHSSGGIEDLVWPGFGAAIGLSMFIPSDDGTAFLLGERIFHRVLPAPVLGVADALIGATFGSLLLLGAATMYRVVRGREGMGLGDVKMMAMVGAFLGLRGAFFTILIGTLLGSLVGVSVVLAMYLARWKEKLAERGARRGLGGIKELRWAIAARYQLPLGTFLGFAALMVVFIMQSSWFELLQHWR